MPVEEVFLMALDAGHANHAVVVIHISSGRER